MTQTIHTPKGRYAVWVEADYGQGHRGHPKLVEISKVTADDFIKRQMISDNVETLEQWEFETLKKLALNKGILWEVITDNDAQLFNTYKQARDYAYSISA